LSVTNTEPGVSRKVHFYAPGESGYQLQVTFGEVHSIMGGGGCVEAGYGVTEVITDATIKSDFHLFTYAP